MAEVKKLYEKGFDGHTFAKYCVEEFEFSWLIEEFYHRLFQEGKLKGKTLIDIGCGPTLRAPLVASRYGCEVYCAEYLKTNLDLVQNWIDKGPDAFDFSKQFKHVAQLEGTDDIGYLEERVRKSVKEVIYCDILADNILHPQPLRQFDMAVSSLCLDCYPDESDYLQGAKGISSVVRPGGYLAFFSSTGYVQYQVGNTVFPSNLVSPELVKKAFTQAGMKVLEICQHYFEKRQASQNCEGFLTLYAVKV